MRQFKLINELGQEFSLDHNPLLHKPKGMGLAFSSSYGNSVDGFFRKTSRKTAQGSVAGDLVFTEEAYTRYREFIKFCEDAEELKLGYMPTDTWYFAPIDVQTVTKGDFEKYGEVLITPVDFRILAPWAKENPSQQSISPSATVLTYPRTYAYTYGTDAAGSVVFDINGDMDGAYTIEVDGVLVSPVITLYKQSGSGWKMVGKADINENFTAAQTLRMSVRPDSPYIEKVSGGLTTDLTDKISILDNAFARPPRGRCKLTLTSDSVIGTVATVRIYDYYRSV